MRGHEVAQGRCPIAPSSSFGTGVGRYAAPSSFLRRLDKQGRSASRTSVPERRDFRGYVFNYRLATVSCVLGKGELAGQGLPWRVGDMGQILA